MIGTTDLWRTNLKCITLFSFYNANILKKNKHFKVKQCNSRFAMKAQQHFFSIMRQSENSVKHPLLYSWNNIKHFAFSFWDNKEMVHSLFKPLCC